VGDARPRPVPAPSPPLGRPLPAGPGRARPASLRASERASERRDCSRRPHFRVPPPCGPRAPATAAIGQWAARLGGRELPSAAALRSASPRIAAPGPAEEAGSRPRLGRRSAPAASGLRALLSRPASVTPAPLQPPPVVGFRVRLLEVDVIFFCSLRNNLSCFFLPILLLL
jgi:hypothetical protein